MTTTAHHLNPRAAAYVASLPATDPLRSANSLVDDAVALQDAGRHDEADVLLAVAELLLDSDGPCLACGAYDGDHDDGCTLAPVAPSFKRGTLFRHGRILDPSFVPGPGQKHADAPKAVCRVTTIRHGNVYYAVGDETKARAYATAERLLADGAEVLS